MTASYPVVVAAESTTALQTVKTVAELVAALIGLYVAYRRMTRTELQ